MPPEPIDDTSEMVHGVVAELSDLETARDLIEDLEEQGTPPQAIALLGPDSEDREEGDMPESEAIGDTAKSAAAGGAGGAIVGGVLGSIVPLAIPGIGPVIAAGLGAVFGAGVGGAAGGMSVAKYNSPAWEETFQTVKRGRFAVGVHHADEEIATAAEEVMRRYEGTSISRFDRPTTEPAE